jgi:penicillin-binding protein 2
LGIGQGEIQVTPLQMANSICLIANRGWYYIPHFVKSVENETDRDTILKPFRQKIKPLNIPDTAYQAVIDGMEMVVTNGTARNAKIPGYSVCAKTGTVENYYRGAKQQNHSFFVAFAPKENPKIAICVVVENAGFGSTWAAPIASLLMEKYLTDSIAGPQRKAEIERISNVSLIPLRIRREMQIRDSLKRVKDSLTPRKQRLVAGTISSKLNQVVFCESPEKEPGRDRSNYSMFVPFILFPVSRKDFKKIISINES